LKADISTEIFEQILQTNANRPNSVKPRIAGQTDPPQFKIGVTNPEPGGGDSPDPADPSASQIEPENPVPVLVSISPAEVMTGNGSFTLTLNGNNFNGTSVINLGGLQLSPSTSSLTSMTVEIPINELAAGVIQVAVTNPQPGGGQSATLPFSIHDAFAPVPTIVNVSPASILSGSGALTIAVEATNLTEKTQATLGQETGTISGNTVTFHLTPAETANPRTIYGIITNPPPGGGSASFLFNILNAAPKITSFSPAQAISGSASAAVKVTGSNFRQDSQITLDGAPIATQFSSPTALIGTIPGALLKDPRDAHVGVNNAPPGGGSVEGGILKIIKGNPVPLIVSLDPATVYGNRGQVITIHGTGFFSGSIVQVDRLNVASTYTDENTISFVLPSTSRTSVSVQVQNPEPGGGASNAISLSLTFVPPQITALSPSFGTAGTQITLTVDGSDFADKAVINFGGISIPATFVNNSELLAKVSLDAAGTIPVSVTNSGGMTSNSVNFVIMSAPLPMLTTVSPTSGVAGTSFNVTLTGTNFIPGATTILVSGNGVTVTGVNVLTQASLIAAITVDSQADPTTRDVAVQTPNGTSGARPFRILAQSPVLTVPSPPIVTDILPNTAAAGSSVVVTVEGANFVPGQTQLTISGPGITISSTQNVSVAQSSFAADSSIGPQLKTQSPDPTTTLTVLVNIDPNAEPGIRFLTVTTPNGSTGGLTFIIMPPGSTGSIIPASGTVGNEIPITITGSNFAADVTTITSTAPGVHISAANVSSPTQLTAAITLDANASIGDQLLTVTTNQSQAFLFFQVLPPDPPTLTAIAPSSAVVGTTVILTLKGTNLVPFGGLVTMTGPGVTLGPVNVDGTSTMTTSVTIDPSAPAGPRSVTVTTPAGTSEPQTFTLTRPAATVPTLTSLSQDTAAAGTTLNLTLTGTGFVKGATTVSVSGAGITTVSSSVVDSGTLVATLSIDALATAGARYVSVTTSSGTSNEKQLTIIPPAPTLIPLTLTSSSNPSNFGDVVTFTALLSSTGNGTPSGTIQFKDGNTVVGTGDLVNGQAKFSTAALGVGLHSITAVYSGDSSFAGTTSDHLTQTVNKSGTSAVLISTTNPSMFGQPVTFTATLNSTGNGSGTPDGTVTFKDGTTQLGVVTLANGQAAFVSGGLTVGSHSITAVYNGSSNFEAATSNGLVQTVNKANTTATVNSSVNPSIYGQSVTLTATVAAGGPASGTPTGAVTFLDSSTVLGTVTLNNGQAIFTPLTLAAVEHPITAVYSGDSNFGTSTSPVLLQTVNKSGTTMTLTSSVNPSVYGRSVTFTAFVTASGASPASTAMLSANAITKKITAPHSSVNRAIYPQPMIFAALGWTIPTGTVTFKDGTITLGTATLDNTGTATFTTTALAIGSHPISAVYAGDNNFNGSTSGVLTETVNQVSGESACRADTELLRPPDHRLVLIHVTVNADQVIDGASNFVLTSVTSSEPDEGVGDGDQSNDIQGWQIGTPDTEGFLRAERSGSGPGRTYSITYTVTKGTASGTCTATVSVPH
jgi:hypothetical protein